MKGRVLFGAVERRVLRRAITLAEELTGTFYCIPGREWHHFPYEVQTLAEGPGPHAPAFADVVRLVPDRSSRRPGTLRQMFRIRLRDDAILEAVEQRSDGIALYPPVAGG